MRPPTPPRCGAPSPLGRGISSPVSVRAASRTPSNRVKLTAPRCPPNASSVDKPLCFDADSGRVGGCLLDHPWEYPDWWSDVGWGKERRELATRLEPFMAPDWRIGMCVDFVERVTDPPLIEWDTGYRTESFFDGEIMMAEGFLGGRVPRRAQEVFYHMDVRLGDIYPDWFLDVYTVFFQLIFDNFLTMDDILAVAARGQVPANVSDAETQRWLAMRRTWEDPTARKPRGRGLQPRPRAQKGVISQPTAVPSVVKTVNLTRLTRHTAREGEFLCKPFLNPVPYGQSALHRCFLATMRDRAAVPTGRDCMFRLLDDLDKSLAATDINRNRSQPDDLASQVAVAKGAPSDARAFPDFLPGTPPPDDDAPGPDFVNPAMGLLPAAGSVNDSNPTTPMNSLNTRTHSDHASPVPTPDERSSAPVSTTASVLSPRIMGGPLLQDISTLEAKLLGLQHAEWLPDDLLDLDRDAASFYACYGDWERENPTCLTRPESGRRLCRRLGSLNHLIDKLRTYQRRHCADLSWFDDSRRLCRRLGCFALGRWSNPD